MLSSSRIYLNILEPIGKIYWYLAYKLSDGDATVILLNHCEYCIYYSQTSLIRSFFWWYQNKNSGLTNNKTFHSYIRGIHLISQKKSETGVSWVRINKFSLYLIMIHLNFKLYWLLKFVISLKLTKSRIYCTLEYSNLNQRVYFNIY